ncbi:MAG: VanW family protein [Anaerolineae bacterium]|nr:VanW family protein [Anaerolineae bacterium]
MINQSTPSPVYARKTNRRKLSRIEEILGGVFLGFVLFFVSILALYSAMQIWYLGRVLPGVSLAGINIDGLSASETAAKISSQIHFNNTGRLLLYDEHSQKNWQLTPAQLGLLLDPDASAQSAMHVGRSSNPLRSILEQVDVFITGEDVAPVMVFDQRLGYALLSQIAQQVDQPVKNAGISLNGNEVLVTASQPGRQVDIPATLNLIREKAQGLQDAAIPLVIKEETPTLLDVTQQANLTRRLLSQPLLLTLPEGQQDADGAVSYQIEPATLAHMLSFDTSTGTDGKADLKVSLSSQSLLAYLSPLAPKLQAQKENARFTFNDSTGQLEVIQSAVMGRTLNLQKSIAVINENVLNGSHSVPLALDLDVPQVTDDKTGQDLGITELVHEETSYFYGSPAERVQNIQAAANQFHGLLIAPGETLSMASVMGDVSLDTGYAEALIIAGGQTIKGVGGGVCQVSTTLFRAAFFSGFPIVERYPHAYRVGYYEYDPIGRRSDRYAGLDATVFVPTVDFKFTNDSDSWLLMETYVNPTYGTLIWKFYGTKDGRTVDWTTSGPTNIVEHPKALYRENSELPAGEVKQMDYAADGADVSVQRTVHRNGEIIHQDTFNTHYEPWQAIYEYGPGTEGMPPADNGDNDENG